ncbi:MAG: 30S ribosomal protein S2 [Candidatus Marinimicrobia bacterium]|nr:30S ribosomal protein S2 [Candidatus Neomarinimicrobiota bacterium]
MRNISLEDLLASGAHFGHMTSNWNPNMEEYIFTKKNGVHIIDLYKTIEQLNKAIELVSSTVKKGGSILFVATKKSAKTVVEEEADRCGMFHVTERWLGGTLTNFMTIKKSIKRLHVLEKDETSGIAETLTKKELLMRSRERNRLQTQHRGIKDMRRLPDVVIVVDARKETIAIAEALRLEIPIIAIVDTNTDPRNVDIPIPANDDSIQAIRLLMGTLADAIMEAKGISQVKETEEVTA